MKPSLKRLLSAATLFFFIMASPVSALPSGGVEVALRGVSQAFLQIEIPSELASIEEIYEAPARLDSKLILHIQNVHGHYEAQEQIKKLLNYLQEKYAFNLIFVEGAAEKLNPDLLKLFPDQKLNTELADYLAKMGELTGPELFLMNAPSDVEAVGIEKTSLYRTNYESFKAVHNAKPATEKFLQLTGQNLDRLSSRFFSPETRRLLGEWKKFESGHRDFLPYIQSLAKDSKKILGMDLTSLFAQVEWPQITRLLVLQSMEKDLDKVKAENEKKEVIAFLKNKRVSEKVIEAIGKLGERHITMNRLDSAQEKLENLPRYLLERLAEEANPKGFQFHDYPAFSLYAGYLILQSELDSRELFHEIEVLFEKILAELTPSEPEKNLMELFRDRELLTKLLKLELSRKEWSRADYRNEWIKPQTLLERLEAIEKQSDELSLPLASSFGPDNFSELNGVYEQALLFYQFATRREDAFFETMKKEMTDKKADKAVLVTGGFHTDGMMDLFRANDINYGVLMPRLQQKIDNVNYLASMLENATTPFDIANIEMIARMQMLAVQGNSGRQEMRAVQDLLLAYSAVARFSSRQELRVAVDFMNASIAGRDANIRFDLQTNRIRIYGLSGFDAGFLVVEEGGIFKLRPEIRRAELRTASSWRVDPQTLLALKRSIEGLNPDTDAEIIAALSAAFNELGVPEALRTSQYRPNVGAKPKAVRDRTAGLLSNVSASPNARPYAPAEALYDELLRRGIITDSGAIIRAELRSGENQDFTRLKDQAGALLGNIFSGMTLEQVVESEAALGVRDLPEGKSDVLKDPAVDFKRQVLNLASGNADDDALLGRIQAKQKQIKPTQIPEGRISLLAVIEAIEDSQLAGVEIQTLMRMIARAKLIQLGVVSGLNDDSTNPPSYNRPFPNLGSVRLSEIDLENALADIEIFDQQLRNETAEVRRNRDVLNDDEVKVTRIGQSKALIELASSRRSAQEIILDVFPQVTLRDLLNTHRDRVAMEGYRVGDGRYAFSETAVASRIAELSEDLSLQDLVMNQTSSAAEVDAWMRMALRYFMTQHRWIEDAPNGMNYTNPFRTQYGTIDVRGAFEWAPLIGDVRTRLGMDEANRRVLSARTRSELRSDISRAVSLAATFLLPLANFAAEVSVASSSRQESPRLASPSRAEFTAKAFADYVMGPRNPSYVFNTGFLGGFTPFINFWGDSVVPMAANNFSWLSNMFAENTQPLFNESGYLAPNANLNFMEAADAINWAGDSVESFRMQGASAFALGLSRVGLDLNDWGVVYTGKIFMRPVGGRFGVSAPALFDGYFKIMASPGFQKLFTSPEYVFDLQPRVVNEFGMSEVGDGIPDTTFANGVGEMFGIWYKAWQERFDRPEPIPGAFNLAVVAEEVRATLEAAIVAAVEKNANPDGTMELDGFFSSVSSTLSLNAGIPIGDIQIRRLENNRAVISAAVPSNKGINSVQAFYSTTVNGARNPGSFLTPAKGGDRVEIEIYTGPFGVSQAFFTLVGYRQSAPEGSGPKLMRQELRSTNGILSNVVPLALASAALLNVPPINAQQSALAMNMPILQPDGIHLQANAPSQDFRKLDFLFRSDLSANWSVIGDDVPVDASGTTTFIYAAAANPTQGFFAVEGTPKAKNTVFDKTPYAQPAYEASMKSYFSLIDPASGIVVNQSSGQFLPGNWWFKSSDPGAEWLVLLLAAYNHDRVPIGQDSSPENVSKLIEKSITTYLNLVDRFGLTVRNQSGELVNTGIPAEVYVNSGVGQFRPEKLTFAFYDAGITLDSLDYVYEASKQNLIPGLKLSDALVERIGNYLNRATFGPFFDPNGILHQTVTTDNSGRVISRSGAVVNQKDNEVLAFIFSLIDRGMLSDLPAASSIADRKADGQQWFRDLAMPYRMVRSGKNLTLTPILLGDYAASGLTSGLYANAAYDLSKLAPSSAGLALSNYVNAVFYQNGLKAGFPVVFSVPSKAQDNQSQYIVSGLFNPSSLAPAGASLGLSWMNSDARVVTNFNSLIEKGQASGSFSESWGFPDSLNPQTLAGVHQGRTTQNIAFGIFGQNFELLQDWNQTRPSYDFAREEFGRIDLMYSAPTNAPLIDLAAKASQRGIFTAKANYPNNRLTYDPNTGNLSVNYNLHPTDNPFAGVYLKMSGVRLTGKTVLTVSIGNNSLGQMAFEFKDPSGRIISKVYSPLSNAPYSFLNFDIPGSGNVAEATIVFSSSTIGTNQKGSVDFLNFYLHEPGRQELRAGKFERFATPDETRELGQIKTMGDSLVQLLNETISKVRASAQQESSARKVSLEADLQTIRSQIAGIGALLDGMSRDNNPAYTNLAKGHPFSDTDIKQPITVLDMYLQAEGSLEEILQQPDRLEQLRTPLVSVMENIGRLAAQQFFHVDRLDAVTAYIRFEPKQIVVQAPEKADSPVITKEGAGVPSKPTKGVILVVDDEPAMRMAIKRVLGASGYVVHTAVHGKDALDKIRGGLMPQVVITDMNMPEMGGEELITTLGGKIPSILISGYVGNAAVELAAHRANGVPVDAVFGKPFEMKTIEAKLDELIRARSGGRAELRTAEGNYLESAVQLGDRRVVSSLGQVSWDVAAEVAGFVLGERDAQAALAFNRAISDSLALSNPLQSIIGQATETILNALALPSDIPNPGAAMGVVLNPQGVSSDSINDLLEGIGEGVGRVYLVGRGAPKELTQGLSEQGVILTPIRRMNEPSLSRDGELDQQGGVIPAVMLDTSANLVVGNKFLPVWSDMSGITDPEISRLVLKIQARLTSKLARILRANPALLKDPKALLGELVKAATLGNEFDFQSMLEFTTRNGRAELRVSGQGVQKFVAEFAARAEVRKAA